MKNIIILLILLLAVIIKATAQKVQSRPFTESLMPDSCSFTTFGRNTYFILEPYYQQTLQGNEGADTVTLIITVLNETRKIGVVETRIVEERELVNGKPIEISRNFFAFCKQTGSIYYFGEEVDMYKNEKIVSHDGAWIAGGNNKPGVIMPGLILLGSRYYQEMAPAVAMDRAEILSMTETMKTLAGHFTNVLKTEETTPIEPKNKEYKYYAPGVGLIKDGDLMLMKYGFVK
jgi:hypothetical protein